MSNPASINFPTGNKVFLNFSPTWNFAFAGIVWFSSERTIVVRAKRSKSFSTAIVKCKQQACLKANKIFRFFFHAVSRVLLIHNWLIYFDLADNVNQSSHLFKDRCIKRGGSICSMIAKYLLIVAYYSFTVYTSSYKFVYFTSIINWVTAILCGLRGLTDYSSATETNEIAPIFRV